MAGRQPDWLQTGGARARAGMEDGGLRELLEVLTCATLTLSHYLEPHLSPVTLWEWAQPEAQPLLIHCSQSPGDPLKPSF